MWLYTQNISKLSKNRAVIICSDSGSTTILNVNRAPGHELPGVNGAGSYIALIIGILIQVDPGRPLQFGKGYVSSTIDIPMNLPTNDSNNIQRVESAFLEPAKINMSEKWLQFTFASMLCEFLSWRTKSLISSMPKTRNRTWRNAAKFIPPLDLRLPSRRSSCTCVQRKKYGAITGPKRNIAKVCKMLSPPYLVMCACRYICK